MTKNNHNEHKLVEEMHELPADIATWKLKCLSTHVSLSLQKASEEKVENSPISVGSKLVFRQLAVGLMQN